MKGLRKGIVRKGLVVAIVILVVIGIHQLVAASPSTLFDRVRTARSFRLEMSIKDAQRIFERHAELVEAIDRKEEYGLVTTLVYSRSYEGIPLERVILCFTNDKLSGFAYDNWTITVGGK